jgi:hypothetical protein
MTVPVLATGVRKARFESTCPACRGPIVISDRIARCPGNLWFHLACYLGHQHQLDQPAQCATERK